MIRKSVTLAVLIFVSTATQAADIKPSEDPTMQIIFMQLPEISNAETKDMVKKYTDLSKTFWIYKKCATLGGSAEKEFINNLAKITGIVRSRFKKEFSVNLSEAQKYTEIPQNRALIEVSTKQISCTANLSASAAIGVVESQDFIAKYE